MKVLIVPSDVPAAQEQAILLCARLGIAGIDALIQPLQKDDAPATPAAPAEELALVVPMGGDGTFLYAARLIDFAPVPILGFNCGTLGFLTGNPKRDQVELVADALAGDLMIERRSTLDAVLTSADGEQHTFTALNELAYTRGASGRIVEYTYAVNGTRIAHLKADGLVVSTATGSTAYALSAGGPIVSPGYSGMVVVPLAPHALNARALVTAPSDVLEVNVTGRNLEESSLFLDGQPLPVKGVSAIEVHRGEREVRYVRGGDDFFTAVSHVFYGNQGEPC